MIHLILIVLGKLYLFFIINNLLVFTIASTILNLYSKISTTVNNGDTINFISLMRSNFNLLAKSLASKCRRRTRLVTVDLLYTLADTSTSLSFVDVSTYWTNYVTLVSISFVHNIPIHLHSYSWYTHRNVWCISQRSLGILLDLAQLFSLLYVAFRYVLHME